MNEEHEKSSERKVLRSTSKLKDTERRKSEQVGTSWEERRVLQEEG